jgi:hypothetical protein
MKMLRWMTLGLVVLSIGGRSVRAQEPASKTYVDENSKDPDPLKIDGVEGRVQGLGGDRMPRVTVLLFTDGRTLVASAMTDKDGKFGLYRVVAKSDGLCPANIPVDVESSLIKHKKLVITMQPKDIDTCSYGMAK